MKLIELDKAKGPVAVRERGPARLVSVSSFASLLACLSAIGCGSGNGSQKDAAVETSVADAGADVPDTRDTAQEIAPATLVLPEYPWWDNSGLAVDPARLEELATGWCVVADDPSQWPEFFFGAMPEAEVAGLCSGAVDPAVALGHMYLSGYYGGLWFRDNADLMGGGEGEGHERTPVSQEDFMVIADNAEQLAQWAASGADGEVLAHNEEALLGPPGGNIMDSMMDALLTLFGYNFGYVKAILANPPAGADKWGLGSPCKGYLDCPVGGTALSDYAVFESALAKLASPPDGAWDKWAQEVEKSKTWSAIGEGLWSEGSIAPDAWRVLVQINVVYLRVTAIAALSSIIATAEGDVETGRCALLLEAATDTWNRAYFLALGADAPAGTMPGLQCPGR